MTKPIKVIQGGTAAGKTYGIVPILIDYATKNQNKKITIVCPTYPGAYGVANDIFKPIMEDTGRWNYAGWRSWPSAEYTFFTGTRVQFRSFDDVGKAVAAGKRDVLFLNEANYFSYEIADALMIRSDFTYIDFNPVNSFWVQKETLTQPNAEFLKLNYLDNEGLSQNTLESLMIRRAKAFYDPEGDPFDPDNIRDEYHANWWRVYGLGLQGKIQGVIFPDVKHIDIMPAGPYIYGLDFGYTHDPTVLTRTKMHQGGFYREEIYYKTDLDIADLIDAMMSAGVTESDPIICDHDRFAVTHLAKSGFNTYFADKYSGSILSGIEALKQYPLYTTRKSKNLHIEEDRYIWEIKNGQPTGMPVDADNHGWDGSRYAIDYILNPNKKHYLAQRKGKRGTRALYGGMTSP